ncbi:hypothetical protein [Mesorhizobium sp. B2-3-15]|uniref:hypothetical protein n=1 Tax=Mesorhizobium sp. B2-3-15 TaxID=2589949 RepID=UPI00112ED6E4|nr:hypothetical protein [Mesorhizobium sp. B2-3-15]TPL64108.1 hypothetical protein FJ954_29810 [Mesorhizobium sp. B2-3-15]
MEAASIHYFDDATITVEIKDGRIVHMSNFDSKSSPFPKGCRLAIVFDPFGEIEPAESITISKGNLQ